MQRLALALVFLSACGPTGSKGLERGQTATAIAVGASHACLRVVDGTLRCFGSNASGQLGTGFDPPAGEATSDAGASEAGAMAPPDAPRLVPGLAKVAGIAAGGAHTCVRLEDASVRCFGANDFGQLGDATTTARPSPVILAGVRNVSALAAGGAHTCAIYADKTVWCWGRNDEGQLGDGSTTSRSSPVRVQGAEEIEQLAAGTFHTCGRRSDGAVLCWGRNDAGQIGDGTVGGNRPRATVALGAGPAAAIAAGFADTCAVLPDRTLRCWGKVVGRSSATSPIGFAAVAAVSLGSSATSTQLCARLLDGSIRCTESASQAPALVPGIVNATDLAGGASFTCARLSDGAARCWAPRGEPYPVIP